MVIKVDNLKFCYKAQFARKNVSFRAVTIPDSLYLDEG